MNKILFTCCLSTIMVATSTLAETEKIYVVPPSSTTSTPTTPPSISDEAARICVTVYNEARWLREEIELANVDTSDQGAVNAHNAKITSYKDMIDNFNRNCAGKQSKSAQEATDELNSNTESSSSP